MTLARIGAALAALFGAAVVAAMLGWLGWRRVGLAPTDPLARLRRAWHARCRGPASLTGRLDESAQGGRPALQGLDCMTLTLSRSFRPAAAAAP